MESDDKQQSPKRLGGIGRDLDMMMTTTLSKGEAALKRAVGLGPQPNVVPEGEAAMVDGEARPVLVGWHPVAGGAGRWFAERTGLGRLIAERTHRYPDPTQHWAVLVGEFVHQLWMDENFNVIYTNEKVEGQEWKTFRVGQTRFNDAAIRQMGESVIATIREKDPVYNLISNNCQTYALKLLDAIAVGSRKEFGGTTLAVYERIWGPGKVADLFGKQVEEDKEQQQQQQQLEGEGGGGGGGGGGEHAVGKAQRLMEENTTQLDVEVGGGGSGDGRKGGEGDDDDDDDDDTKSKSRGVDDDGGDEAAAADSSQGNKEVKKTSEVKRQIRDMFSRLSRSK